MQDGVSRPELCDGNGISTGQDAVHLQRFPATKGWDVVWRLVWEAASRVERRWAVMWRLEVAIADLRLMVSSRALCSSDGLRAFRHGCATMMALKSGKHH